MKHGKYLCNHINIRHHYIGGNVEQGSIAMDFIPVRDTVADILICRYHNICTSYMMEVYRMKIEKCSKYVSLSGHYRFIDSWTSKLWMEFQVSKVKILIFQYIFKCMEMQIKNSYITFTCLYIESWTLFKNCRVSIFGL